MANTRDIFGDIRHLASPDGERWIVYELSGVGYDRRRSLVFESEAQVRRVRSYPADWRTLSDEALYNLSWRP